MEVNLQVVGVFYNSNVTVDGDAPTVETLLQAAHKTPGNAGDRNPANAFSYSTNTDNGRVFASGFMASFENPVKSRVLGGKTYPAGSYKLAENLGARPAYTVWQYYMFDKDGRYLNTFGNATPFSMQSLTDVPVPGTKETADVARVTWRLVSILAGPTGPVADDKMSTYIGV